jgi:hypothetical protein
LASERLDCSPVRSEQLRWAENPELDHSDALEDGRPSPGPVRGPSEGGKTSSVRFRTYGRLILLTSERRVLHVVTE